jgi:hypothetical protein
LVEEAEASGEKVCVDVDGTKEEQCGALTIDSEGMVCEEADYERLELGIDTPTNKILSYTVAPLATMASR